MNRWDNPDIPHKGWECAEVIDLGEGEENHEPCQMCGNENVRYAHMMIHPDYLGALQVGCICAEKMTEDYVNPRKNQNAVKNMTIRQKNFNRREWNYNPRKNSYTKKYKGRCITIVQCRYGT